jgi:transcriptional regulator with XRE-family HTH domain
MSQEEFARRFGFPVATLRNWESGKRKPRGPALALLRIIAYHPAVAVRAMIRVRRGREPRPELRSLPPRCPAEFESPRVIDDDLEP